MGELLKMVFSGRLPEGEDLTSAYQYGIRHGVDRLRAKYADNHGVFKVKTIMFDSPEEFVLTKAIQCSPWKSLEKIKAEGCSLSKNDITAIAEANRKGFPPSMNLDCLAEFVLMKVIQCSPWKSLVKIKAEGCSLSEDDISAIHAANREGFLPSMNLDCLGEFVLMKIIQCSPWKSLVKIKAEGCSLSKNDRSAIHAASGKGFLPSMNLDLCGTWTDPKVHESQMLDITSVNAPSLSTLSSLSCLTIGSQISSIISCAHFRDQGIDVMASDWIFKSDSLEHLPPEKKQLTKFTELSEVKLTADPMEPMQNATRTISSLAMHAPHQEELLYNLGHDNAMVSTSVCYSDASYSVYVCG